ncbi:hypothetical protein DDW09_03030 [Sulfolobus sp. SCGC AB-777_L09]|nr:hypothetical protein DDW09_03030 [Sulfolobus sp. SCGC AB-777_L09]
MKGYLEVNGHIITRKGALNAYWSDGLLIIANPSEVLAHEDEVKIIIRGDNVKVTDQAYTKILSRSNVKIYTEVIGDEVDFLPHPVIFYDGSNAYIENIIRVEKRARVLEGFILGRGGHGEVFNQGNVKAVTKIYFKDKLIIYDIFKNSKFVKNALLTYYEVNADGEYDYEKFLVNHNTIDSLWRKYSNINF